MGAATIGSLFFEESIDVAGIVGMTLVIAGVVTLNLYSAAYNPA